MKTLTKLYLRGTSITDAGLEHLAGLTNLTELDLSDVAMTDAGLASLAGLTKLRRLNLQSANVTDEGIEVLRNMPELEELSLYRTKVSNAGLAKLSGLKNLRSVDLRYSRVTSSGVRDMAANLPKADILVLEYSNSEPSRAKDAAVVANQGEAAIAEWLGADRRQSADGRGQVTSVSLNGTTVTDRELAILTKLPKLATLSLQHTENQSARPCACREDRVARTARSRPYAAWRLRACVHRRS